MKLFNILLCLVCIVCVWFTSATIPDKWLVTGIFGLIIGFWIANGKYKTSSTYVEDIKNSAR